MDKDLLLIRQVVEKEFVIFQHYFSAAFAKAENKLVQDVFCFVKNKKGKQIRPILVLLAGKLCGAVNEKTWQSAVAVEMLHTASLLHDDVVDETLERRGNLSVNAMFDNKTAVLSGDLLLTKSMQYILPCNEKSIQLFVALGQRIAAGELLQLEKSFSRLLEQDYFEIIKCKTAALFSACLELGALSVDAQPKVVEQLRIFGEYLGCCFQMKDDIFDYMPQVHIGKPTLNDIREGKITLPLIYALKKATIEEQEQFKERMSNLPVSDETVHFVNNLVEKYEGCMFAAKKMEEYAVQGRAALAMFAESPEKEALLNMLQYTMTRTN